VSGPVFDFEDVFDEAYLYFYEPRLEEASAADAELIWHLLELEPGIEVLDLACGYGRIANGLAERAARVMGLAKRTGRSARAESS
jgi:cyclopropane fatty-acyl-phospholipid synthase-like methyltransferase